MKAISTFLMVLTIPVAVLNVSSGVVSGIWLIILKDWNALLLGVAILFFSTFVLGILLLPGIALGAPAAFCLSRGKTLLGLFFCVLTSTYILALMTLWCCGLLYLFVHNVESSSVGIIPYLLWSYSLAIGPWSYMASKESEDSPASIAAFMDVCLAGSAYIVVGLLIIFANPSILSALKVFAGFMFVGILLHAVLVYITEKEELRARQEHTDFDWQSPEHLIGDSVENHMKTTDGTEDVLYNFVGYCEAYLCARCNLSAEQAQILILDPELVSEMDEAKHRWASEDLKPESDPDDFLITWFFDAPEMKRINMILERWASQYSPELEKRIKDYLKAIDHPLGN